MAVTIKILGDEASVEKALAKMRASMQLTAEQIDGKAKLVVEKSALERENLEKLAATYKAIAAAAEKGSAEQVAAADAAARALKKLDATAARSTAATKTTVGLGGLGSAAKKTEGLVSKLGNSMALWFGAPALGAGIASAIHGTQQYAAAMEQLHTQAGASQYEVKRMSTALLSLGPQVGTSADVLATGLYHLESQGLRGAKALSTLRIAAEGARIGNANLEDVTNALGAAVYAGIKGTENYSHTMGVLNATVGAGDMHMQDLADAMSTGLPAAAATYGVSIRDVGAALAVFGDSNIRGAEAGTRLASALRLMAAPSKAAAKELAGLHISSTQLADDIRNHGLTYAIGDLKQHMDAMGLTASQQGVVLTRAFGGRQAQGILLLIKEFDRLKQKEEAVGAGGQKFGRDWAAYTQQSQFATQKFQAALETLRIEVGNAILPEFTKATNSLAKWIDKENQSGQIAKDVKKALGDVVTVLHDGKTAIDKIDYVTGGFTHTLEILLGLKVATTISGWSTAIAGFGTASVVAEGEVGGLRAALLGLGAPEVLAALAAAYGAYKLFDNMSAPSVTAPKSYGPQLKAGETLAKVQNDIGFYTASGQTNTPTYFALTELERLMQKAGTVVSTAAQVAQATKKAVADIAAIPSTLTQDAAAARQNVGKQTGAAAGPVGGNFSQSQVYNLLIANGATPQQATALSDISTREDSTGDPGRLNNNPSSGDYSMGLFQENFLGRMGVQRVAQYAPQFGKSSNTPVASFVQWLGQHPAAQAKIALQILGTQGLSAWTTAQPQDYADLGGSNGTTDTGGASAAQLAALGLGPDPTKKTKAQLAAERAQKAAAALHAALQQLSGKVKSDVAEINSDLSQHLLDGQTAKKLQAQAKTITEEIGTGTKKALPKIRTDISALHAAIQLQLSLAGERKKLKAESADIDALVKAGVISPAAVAQLRVRSQSIGTAIANGTKDSLPTIRQSIADLKSQISEWTAQATAVSNWNSQIATLKTDISNQLQQAIGRPDVYATPEALAAAEQGANRITNELASKLVTPAVRAKLQTQLKSFQTTIKSGLNGLVSTISSEESKFQTAWGRIANAQDTAFDRVSQQHLNDMQTALDTALAKMQVTITGFGNPFLFGGSITQTPSQIAAAQLQAQHDAQQAAEQLAADQAQAATDRANGADAATILADDKAVSEDLYQQKLKALQDQGDLEAQAAQTQLQTAQDNYTKQQQAAMDAYSQQRDLLKQAMDDQVQTIIDGMTNGTIATKDGFDQLAKVYADNGVPLGNAAFVLAGKIYNGLKDGGIQAAIDLIQNLQDQIANLDRMVGVTPPQATLGNIAPGSTVAQAANSSTSFAQFSSWAQANHIPGFATGVRDFAGGYAMVGEHGPELVRLPKGSDVIPNHHLRALATGTTRMHPLAAAGLDTSTTTTVGGTAAETHLHVHFHGGTFIGTTDRKVAKALAPHLRSELIKTGKRNVTVGLK